MRGYYPFLTPTPTPFDTLLNAGVYYSLEGKRFPYARMDYRPAPYGVYASGIGAGKGARWVRPAAP